MPTRRLLAGSLIALLGATSCRTFTGSEAQIQKGITAAIQASDLSSYAKSGCIASLNLWAEEKAPPRFSSGNANSALIFLGDTYLSYNMAFVGFEHDRPTLIRHVSEGPDQAYLSKEELFKLSSLVSASKRDGPPRHRNQDLHQTCVVFYTPIDGYFVVQPDEQEQSERSTDAAILYMSQVSVDAP